MRKINLLIISLIIASSINAQTLTSGGSHCFLVCSDGTVNAWGSNGQGQYGNGTNTTSKIPKYIGGFDDFTSIVCGYAQTLAIKNDGTLWAFGWNNKGQLGDGTLINSNIPVQVVGLTGITSASGGYGHSLALKNDGTVWAWGANDRGQLGDGTFVDQTTPVQVVGLSGIIAVSASGASHSMALKNDGTVWTWGGNWAGQLGDGTTTNNATATQLNGITGIIAIAAADGHSLILKNDGTVWAFGENSKGQVGDGTSTSRNTPVQVIGLTAITAITGGEEGHSMALKNDGTVWAWGNNFNGQIGDGTTVNRKTATQVSSLTGVSSISGGRYFSLALKNDGSVWSWGYHSVNGFSKKDSIPVQILNTCTTNSLEDISEQLSATIFPNPSNGQFQIEIDNSITFNTKLEIYNTVGEKVYVETLTQQLNQIDVSKLTAGIYFVKLLNDTKAFNQKIIIQ